ncbi:MAG TPA: T9SS type A sorting domain-containing protein [Bacteroidales bacterium]|nr:T9SS type A sorting domain-containing protein [Bacteroidales bacterium]HRZ77256.1 T9SS type A sorting domain-containing protein [Bacteroidales bacterium]
MIRIITLVAASLAAFTLFTAELSSSSGSPGGKTGSPGDGGATCSQCHGGTPSPQTGWITSNIPASGYVPGQTYTITATGTHPGVSRFGFEVTAEKSGGTKTGGFTITDVAQTRMANSNNSVTHTSSGFSPSGSSKSWSFDWTAPASGSGAVTFYGAFNAANGNGATSGDVIYTSSLSVNESVSTGINLAAGNAIKVFPNPATDRLSVSWEPSVATLVLWDMSGRDKARITLLNGEGTLELAGIAPGMYFLGDMEGRGRTERVIIR